MYTLNIEQIRVYGPFPISEITNKLKSCSSYSERREALFELNLAVINLLLVKIVAVLVNCCPWSNVNPKDLEQLIKKAWHKPSSDGTRVAAIRQGLKLIREMKNCAQVNPEMLGLSSKVTGMIESKLKNIEAIIKIRNSIVHSHRVSDAMRSEDGYHEVASYVDDYIDLINWMTTPTERFYSLDSSEFLGKQNYYINRIVRYYGKPNFTLSSIIANQAIPVDPTWIFQIHQTEKGALVLPLFPLMLISGRSDRSIFQLESKFDFNGDLLDVKFRNVTTSVISKGVDLRISECDPVSAMFGIPLAKKINVRKAFPILDHHDAWRKLCKIALQKDIRVTDAYFGRYRYSDIFFLQQSVDMMIAIDKQGNGVGIEPFSGIGKHWFGYEVFFIHGWMSLDAKISFTKKYSYDVFHSVSYQGQADAEVIKGNYFIGTDQGAFELKKWDIEKDCAILPVTSQSKLLITYFSPFNNKTENASEIIIKQCSQFFEEINQTFGIAFRRLPVVWGYPSQMLRSEIYLNDYEQIIMLGEYDGDVLRVERGASRRRSESLDELGRSGNSVPYSFNGPTHYSAPSYVGELNFDSSSAVLSDDAGAYLCEEAYYCGLHWTNVFERRCDVYFIHVPRHKVLENNDDLKRTFESIISTLLQKRS